LVTVHTGAETIQGRKLFKGGNYSREETICGNTVNTLPFSLSSIVLPLGKWVLLCFQIPGVHEIKSNLE
jgi:hypothetical protein